MSDMQETPKSSEPEIRTSHTNRSPLSNNEPTIFQIDVETLQKRNLVIAYIRLSIVGSWLALVLFFWLEMTVIWLVLVSYLGLSTLTVYLLYKKIWSKIPLFAYIVIDIIFVTILIHCVGSLTSQLVTYYVLILVGYKLQAGREAGVFALVLSIASYLSLLILEWSGVLSYAPYNFADVIIPLTFANLILSFCVFAFAQIGVFLFVSVIISRIEKYMENERALIASEREAHAQSAKLAKQVEEALRLESLGRLAGGVAHDFNNILTGILSYSRFLKEEVSDNPNAKADLDVVIKAATRAGHLTSQLLAFSRKQIIQTKALDVNSIIGNVDEIIRRTISEQVECRFELSKNLNAIKGDQAQIEQVIMNLVVNAHGAMPDGGVMTISTSDIVLDKVFCLSHVDAKPGEYVKISVSDSGIGMDTETKSKIFEPFFTTKKISEGTGLGLATVYGIVRQSGGIIDVTTAPGEGAQFDIYLPSMQEKLTPPPPPPYVMERIGQETILLAEDDETVRKATARILRGNGYTVREASSGEEALKDAAEYQERIHMLITDVVMTGISGKTLADKLKKSRPEIGILFMSGYTEDSVIAKAVREEGMAFMAKPFTGEILLEEVRKIIRQN
ncbi:MAG: response regulator [Proteobacteria bacterium]|nr:response regulator [Pseudomonadota bacterium]